MGIRSSPEVKWRGCGVDHPPTYSAEVEEKVELYFYPNFGISWALTA